MGGVRNALFALVIVSGCAMAQAQLEMQRLAAPRLLELSPDGSHLWYKIGADDGVAANSG